MKMQLLRRIAIVGSDRTGISRHASPRRAAGLPFHCFQVDAAGCNLKSGWQNSLRRTAGETGPIGTVVAGMRMLEARRRRQSLCETECSAISVPEAILRVDENAERRWSKSFSPHRPLLKRLPRWIGREIGGGAKGYRHRFDHGLRPRIERIFATAIGRAISPAPKRRPDRTSDISEQDNGFGRLPVRQHRCGFAIGKRNVAA